MSSSAVSLPPSSVELNLLLEWPNQRTRPEWVLICAGSLLFHVVIFYFGTRLPSLLGERQPQRQIIVHRIPLYLPPDLMTQKAPNRAKLSKQIDLADLLASQAAQPRASLPVRRFEPPKQPATKNPQPQILPQAPAVAVNQTPVSSLPLPGALPAPAPPPVKASAGPFQNIDEAAPPDAHPKLAPPKSGVQAAIDRAAQDSNSRELSVSDDVPDQLAIPRPGALGQAPAQHTAVELQSDPNGADFKNYLRSILTIVRANWKRVIPESARMGMLRGRTVVEFVIDRNGSIPKLVTADSSGSRCSSWAQHVESLAPTARGLQRFPGQASIHLCLQHASQMSHDGDSGESERPLIGLRTAIFLYALLVIVSCLVLKGKPLYLALIIVGGLAAKSYLHYLRERADR